MFDCCFVLCKFDMSSHTWVVHLSMARKCNFLKSYPCQRHHNKGIMPTKELGHGTSIVYNSGVTHDGLCDNRFISMRDVEHWIAIVEVFLEVILGWNGGSISRGDFIGCLDDVFRLMAMIRARGLLVNI